MKRLGFVASGVPYTIKQLVDITKKAENAGFESVWVAEDYYAREGVSTLACYAYNTTKIKIGTAILNPYTRHPVNLALTMATLDELSGGRMILGLGAGFPPIIQQMTDYYSPLTTIRETAQLVRELYSKKTVKFEGKATKAIDISLGVCPYLTPLGTFEIPRNDIPIYIGSMGPKMLEMAGEVGDGLLISAGYSVAHSQDSIERAKVGVNKVGKDFANYDVAGLIASAVSSDGTFDIGIRGMIASMLSAFLNDEQIALSGFTTDDTNELKTAFNKGGWQAAAPLVTSEMMNAFAAAGTVDQVVDRLVEYEKAGVKLPLLFLMGGSSDLMIEAGRQYIGST